MLCKRLVLTSIGIPTAIQVQHEKSTQTTSHIIKLPKRIMPVCCAGVETDIQGQGMHAHAARADEDSLEKHHESIS